MKTTVQSIAKIQLFIDKGFKKTVDVFVLLLLTVPDSRLRE